MNVLVALFSILILLKSARYIHTFSCNYESGNYATCNNVSSIANFPTKIVENMIVIDSTIPLLSTNSLKHLQIVQQLTLNDDKIKTIEPGAFNGMINLNLLSLTGNDISNLKKGSINSLKHLKKLYLGNNKLTKINKKYFADMTNLKYLDLSMNSIDEVSVDAFQGLTNLIDFNLSYNHLSSLPTNCFKDMVALQSLRLHRNSLTNLQIGVFTGLRSLTYLDIKTNLLTDINPDIFLPINQLFRFYFNYNKITHLDAKKLLSIVPNLEFVYLNENPWSCVSLPDMIDIFKNGGVQLMDSTGTIQAKNVDGISCVDDELLVLNPSVPKSTVNTKIQEENDDLYNNKYISMMNPFSNKYAKIDQSSIVHHKPSEYISEAGILGLDGEAVILIPTVPKSTVNTKIQDENDNLNNNQQIFTMKPISSKYVATEKPAIVNRNLEYVNDDGNDGFIEIVHNTMFKLRINKNITDIKKLLRL